MGSEVDSRARAGLGSRYAAVRGATERLCGPLEIEDQVVQSMPSASPTKWHLGHTSWFFETFVLAEWVRGYQLVEPAYRVLFNSYYNAVGEQFDRPSRGVLSRPTVEQVLTYRRRVDHAMGQLLAGGALGPRQAAVVELGLQHEQQHQELMLTDIKHVFWCNPLRPVYRPWTAPATGTAERPADRWLAHPGGLYELGHAPGEGFAYDNEGPRHRVFLPRHALASRLVTCGEYLRFIEDGGYSRPELWLDDGWTVVQRRRWEAPLYWQRTADGGWREFTLAGAWPLDPHRPVTHVSFYEADAYARWAGLRLPTEAEWEAAAATRAVRGNFVESGLLHPAPQASADQHQLFGDVWEWTASPYRRYPGYRSPAGALGEYNAKFMCNQLVLRGGSCATPADHMRATYRNFFQPETRWQFSGIRLARDEGESQP